MMKAIIYISQSNHDFDSDALLSLSKKAESYNATVGVTGYLWYEKGLFIQYIEGHNNALDKLMLRIKSDTRHTILHQLDTSEIPESKFPNWNMRHFHSNQMIEISLEKILTDQLLFLKSISINDNKLTDNIWRLVDTLAKYNQ